MATVVSLDELRKNLTDIAGQVMYGNATIRVRKYKREGMVLMSEGEYERVEKLLINPGKRFTKEEWDRGFNLMDKMRTNTGKFPVKKVETAIDKALTYVRQKKNG